MNLAFQALLILAMLLPGLIFRSAYNRGVWNFPMGRLGPVSEQIPKAVIHSLWLNALWAMIARAMHEAAPHWVWAIDFRAVACWISNDFGRDQVEFPRALDALVASPSRIFAYLASLYGCSWLAGEACLRIVRGRKLDLKYRRIRFDHEWHYLLRGEAPDFPDPGYNQTLVPTTGFQGKAAFAEDCLATVVAAVVDFKETSYVYLGIVVDYYFDEQGNLDRLLLSTVKRRKLMDHEGDSAEQGSNPAAERFQEIRGYYFVLRMSELRTLNIDYITRADMEAVDALAAGLPNKPAKAEGIEPPNPGWIPDRRPSG